MQKCESCGSLMVRADMYDPDGTVPLKIVQVDGKHWACINIVCIESLQNQKGGASA